MILPPTPRQATPRRGMLLLVVLGILALFLVIGVVGILVALRARETARAFAAASASDGDTAALARTNLDEALLRLIRGPSTGGVTESLLEDKYGTSQSCQVTGLAGVTTAVITGTVAGLDLSKPAAIAGRVLTFVPAVGDPTGPTSYRILRTGTVTNTLLLANAKPRTPLPLPTRFPCEAVINGREFVAEPYDAFDDDNKFLTQPVLEGSIVKSVARPAFGAGACQVDNDGDGVPDGVWLPDALPRQRTSTGGELKFDVSYLVLDLDGRINLNAHGSLVQAPPSAGMGYGPADINVAGLIPSWATLLRGGSVTTTATTSTATQWRPAPQAEATQPGRYTAGSAFSTAAPGSGASTTGTNPLNADYWMVNPVPNSPTDLKSQLRVYTTAAPGSPPTLTFARPASAAWASGTDTTDVVSTGTDTHPYALRLDDDAPRAGGSLAVDALFTVGELERILRPFDTDAATLAPRLAALLDNTAEQQRMTVTTDSWDTPAITGDAINRTGTAVAGGNPYDVLSPETVAGLRFNLNRPIATSSGGAFPAGRQAYFRQLYTLAVALTGVANSAAAAQWAANVIEFRDPDSIMSWYGYDSNPLDGVWTPDAEVWGMERPELVITEATASDTQAQAKLYRPWAAWCTGANTVATERIDASLGVSGTTNTLNAAKVSGTAVWRVSIGGTAVGLDKLLTSATAVAVNTEAGQVTLACSSMPKTFVLQRLADPNKSLGAKLDTDTTTGTNAYVDVHRVSIPQGPRQVSRWLHWPNRDFVSHGELLAVPSGDPGLIPEAMFAASENSLARSQPLILEATIVPSRFAGANVSVANAASFLAGTGFQDFQYGHFSSWREAGRVNVNTIVDNNVWTVLGAGQTNPFMPGSADYPAKTAKDLLLAVQGINSDANNTGLRYRTPIRLANIATVRSHVFAVWITLKITDSSPNAGPPQYARLFAIVDRSIPVGYDPGRALNVRETIRLQRFLP